MLFNFRIQKTHLLKVLLSLLFTSLALAFLVGQAHAAAVLDVTPSGGTYNSIQAAINASPFGSEPVTIRVAEGRYNESLSIGQAQDLTIEGGWNSSFTNRDTNRATIVNGGSFAAAITIFPSTVSLDGLTITHGSSSGLWVSGSDVAVRNSKIGRNTNAGRGGGVFAEHSTLTIEDSLVSENSVVSGSGNTDATVGNILTNGVGYGYGGGGIYATNTYLTVRNSTIRDNYDNSIPSFNVPGSGGGIHLSSSEATIEKSRILNNLALTYGGSSRGGGIYSTDSDLSLTNTIVAGNYANYSGGGLFFDNGGGQTQIEPPTLQGVNDSKPNNLTIVNSTFASNASDRNTLFAILKLPANTGEVEANAGTLGSAPPGGGGGAQINTVSGTSTVSILNSIFWGNRDSSGTAPYSRTNDLDLSKGFGTTLNISYSDIGVATGAPFVGAGNISANPLFVDSNDNHLYDASTANYHLMKFSPAIDSGTAAGAPAADIDGTPRPLGLGFDMGAYEEPYNFDNKAPKLKINTPSYSITQSKTNKFKVRWSATDPSPSSGGLMYRIWVRRGGSSTWRLWQNWTSKKSRMFNGRRRKTYYFRGVAKDAAGNQSSMSKSWSTIVPADASWTNNGISGEAGVNFVKNSSAFKKNYFKSTLRSTTNGAYITYRYKAKQFTLWATKGKRNGKAKVYIDGKFSKLINTNRSTSKHRVMVYKKNFSKTKYHTIKIVNVGRGSKYRNDFDALGVKLP